jgi:putative DNA primase/helicase
MKLIAASVLLRLHLPVRKQHWGERITSNQVGMIYGERGKGKTWLALALALSMSTKCPFLGMHAKNRRRVFYLDGEMDLKGVQGRLAAIAKGFKVSLTDSLQIFTPETFKGLLPAVNADSGLAEIDTLVGEDWDVLFIDNYSAWSADGRETAEAWSPLMRWMLRHKHAGRTVIVVHHTGKNGQQRGSSRHEDALDWSIALESLKAQALGDLAFVLQWKKSRHLSEADCGPISVTMNQGEGGAVQWQHIAGKAEDPKKSRARQLHATGRTNAEIARELGVDRSSVGRWLNTG